ncbi:hypothetical protein [Jiulongibacter sp. NS-SX5]|uniref:hypothetical protein n=1 Tax=Jiulongibacter sp. NS-SX5 TaxID=3463854 RepID=UPI0040591B82
MIRIFILVLILAASKYSIGQSKRVYIKIDETYLNDGDASSRSSLEDYIELEEASFGVESRPGARGQFIFEPMPLTIRFKNNSGWNSYPGIFLHKHLGTLLHDGEIIFQRPSIEGSFETYQIYKFDDFVIMGTENNGKQEGSNEIIVDFILNKLEIIVPNNVSGDSSYGWDFTTGSTWPAGS